MKQLDAIDRQILSILQENGRITVKEMAERLKLSTTPVFERTKKLERAGIIDHYAAIVNPERLGKKLYAFAHISLKDHSKSLVEIFAKEITSFPQVLECHYVTGDSDFILKILLDDMEMYREFVMERLFTIPNIAKIESYLSLSVEKQSNIIPIGEATEKD